MYILLYVKPIFPNCRKSKKSIFQETEKTSSIGQLATLKGGSGCYLKLNISQCQPYNVHVAGYMYRVSAGTQSGGDEDLGQFGTMNPHFCQTFSRKNSVQLVHSV